MRQECDRWMKQIDDKGLIDEKELIASFYPNRKVKQTKAPNIKINDLDVAVEVITPGSRLGFRYTSEKNPHYGWTHYKQPISSRPDDTLEIIAHRIGYKAVTHKIYNGAITEVLYPQTRIEYQDEMYSHKRPKLPPVK